MKSIYLETFGCQMNVLDSELIESQLRSLGYTFTPDLEQAQVVLYNTCSVREQAEQKVWSRLGLMKMRKEKQPELIVGVIGCMAERDGAGLMKRMPQVDLMCGPGELDALPTLLENFIKTGRQQHALAGNTSRRTKVLDQAEEDGLELLDLSRSFSATENKYQAYVRVVRGCNKFCTYCVVPFTRGEEVSRSPQALLEECKKLVDAGALEITLLGQTINHYVFEHEEMISTPKGPAKRKTKFAELLQMLHDKLPSLPRLRFVTSFPADFGDDILQVMALSPRICRYLHVPAQSGSDRILKMMNRGYSAAEYLDLLDRARKIVPGISFAGDFIVGFPTETDEDYQATRNLLKQARYKNAFIFKYSPRPGTLAIKRHEDDVSDEVKRLRNNDLLMLQNKISHELNQEMIGQTVDVLCEGPSGWKGGDKESVIAGGSSGSVEFGPTLARAIKTTQINTTASSVLPMPSEESVQMTGRSTNDQIIVFQGSPDHEGKIVRVKVKTAHGLTIFADLAHQDQPLMSV